MYHETLRVLMRITDWCLSLVSIIAYLSFSLYSCTYYKQPFTLYGFVYFV